ncbi:MAG: DPP IV N-terminal domain-containing protein [Bacteroidetes bacterium]|nr:DPP IV N-terminal domain-containing protein [Bacteroidota bacterium]
MHFPDAKTDTVLRLKELNTNTKSKLKSLPSFKWLDKGLVYYQDGNDLKKGTRTAVGYMWEDWFTFPDNAENIMVDKSMNVAYTIDNNLYLLDKNKKVTALSNDVDKNIINGGSKVHRNEWGIAEGIFFSPNGKKIAYYHMDQTMVADYPIINWLTTPAKNENVKYPMAGGISHQVQLRVYNTTTGKTVTMQVEGAKDQYLTNISWSPDEEYVYIQVLNRDQDHMWLNQYNAETGLFVKTLLEEKSDKYVEPLHPITFLPNDDNKFIYWSQRNGYMHLYLYNTKGEMLKQLTKGKWIVNELVGTNKDAHELIFTSSKESPLEKHIYTVNWETGKMHRVDNERGVHTAICNESGEYVYDVFNAGAIPIAPEKVASGGEHEVVPRLVIPRAAESVKKEKDDTFFESAAIPKRSEVLATNGDYEKVLLNAPNTLADYDRPQISNVTLTADDGTLLYGKLILPTNFSNKKKYPVIVYLYNGPHVQLVRNSFPESGNLWYEYMAQHGYIVFTMDGRGSSNRGLAFENATWGKLGTVEMDDQLKGVEYLKSLPFVDANRMGVHGWSFGGFMTTSLMLRHPGVFKVAVAGGPVMDWSMYEIMYTERYMNTPQQNPEGYKNSALFDKVKNLKGKLMLIHGTDDATVVWQHSINFIKKSVDENVQVDYFVYPGYEHNVRGKDRVHLMQKITDYFDTYLK